MLKVTIQLRREKGEYPVEFAFDNISETGIHAGMYWVRSTDGTTRIPIDRIASVTEETVSVGSGLTVQGVDGKPKVEPLAPPPPTSPSTNRRLDRPEPAMYND